MAETVLSRDDALEAEKQQLRQYMEQQHNNPHAAPHHSAYTSYAPPFPTISLADDWQPTDSSPLPPLAPTSTTVDDYFTSYLDDNSDAHFQPAYPAYPAASDYFPAHAADSPPHKVVYDQPFTGGHKRAHEAARDADGVPPTKRLTVQLPAPSKKRGHGVGAVLQAQYPLLSSELVDGFFAPNVNVGSGVMGGLDDSELGLGMASLSRQASETSSSGRSDKVVEHAKCEPSVPSVDVLPTELSLLPLEPQTSQLSQLSSTSSTAPSASFQPASLSSILSNLSTPSSSSTMDNTSSISNLTNRLLLPDTRGEGQRRMKRRLTDKQRRAKIKEGLEQLRSLVALHGNASSDQATIVNSSVDLVQQLVDEREELKHQLRQTADERAEIEREQQLAIDKQRLAAAVLPSTLPASASSTPSDQAVSPELSVLLHHLSNILTPALGGVPKPAGEAVTSGAGGIAAGLEQLVLSQYFLHTLKLLTNLPRNNQP